MKARLEGLRGIFHVLAEQHGEVVALLERAKGDAATRAALWPQLRRELRSHELAEVRELYPLLRADPTTRQLADHHDAEARELDALVLQLDALDPRSDEAGKLLEVLADRVVHHADEEETKIVPRAQAALGEDKTEELEDTVLLAKSQLVDAT
ncbi:MAG TPA: hemerythrin domain-containing protein [Kofleriaceae bacterium]|nr:hemerythrin domain-containing protein [Kofleriaceae bacterium]